MTLGTLVAAGYIGNVVLGSVQTLAAFQIDFKAAKMSFQRISDIIDLKHEGKTGTANEVDNFNISITDMVFAYSQGKPVLKGLNTQISGISMNISGGEAQRINIAKRCPNYHFR